MVRDSLFVGLRKPEPGEGLEVRLDVLVQLFCSRFSQSRIDQGQTGLHSKCLPRAILAGSSSTVCLWDRYQHRLGELEGAGQMERSLALPVVPTQQLLSLQ